MHRSLRRDDLLLPYAFIGAFLFHLLVVLFGPPLRQIRFDEIRESVYSGIRVQVFQNIPATFSRFSARERIYAAPNPHGVPFATSGTVASGAGAVPRPDELVPVTAHRTEAIPVARERLYFGAHGSDAAAPAASRQSTSSGLFLPESPDGDQVPRDRSDAQSYFASQEPNASRDAREAGGSPRASAPRAEEGRLTRPRSGEVEFPGPAAEAMPAPRSVAGTQEIRPAAPAMSVGQNVSDRPTTPAVIGEDVDMEGRPGYSRRRIVSQPLPTYPAWAEEQHIEASVIFDITVVESGRVKGTPRLVRTSGYPDLDLRARNSVMGWIYEPRVGQEEARRVNVQFRLRPARRGR